MQAATLDYKASTFGITPPEGNFCLGPWAPLEGTVPVSRHLPLPPSEAPVTGSEVGTWPIEMRALQPGLSSGAEATPPGATEHRGGPKHPHDPTQGPSQAEHPAPRTRGGRPVQERASLRGWLRARCLSWEPATPPLLHTGAAGQAAPVRPASSSRGGSRATPGWPSSRPALLRLHTADQPSSSSGYPERCLNHL